jgi:hypothetical protein
MDTMGASTDRQQIEDLSDAKHGAQDSGVAKRKAKIDAKHRWKNNKRAREGWILRQSDDTKSSEIYNSLWVMVLLRRQTPALCHGNTVDYLVRPKEEGMLVNSDT